MTVEDKPVSVGIEIELKSEDSFNVIRETVTRMGIPSVKDGEPKKLYQTAHILHKRSKYYIVHFKELFLLDGRKADISDEDYARRNTIANLLESWGLLTILDKSKTEGASAQMLKLKIIKSDEKNDWQLISKYSIGNKKNIQSK